jgi:hypothetical protein
MRTITIPWPDPAEHPGVAAEVPVLLDHWFPPLTSDQWYANAIAALDNKPLPYPDPNLITVRLERQ